MSEPNTSFPREPVAEYRFQGNSQDSSSANCHGVAHAVTFCDDRFGNPNSAAQFNGIDSFVIVAPPPVIDVRSFSISVWVRFDEMPDEVWSNCVVAQDNGDDENPDRRVFQLSCFHGHIVWHLMTDDRDPIYRRRVRLHEYFHIVATCNDGVHSLYVDSEFQDAIQRTVPEANAQPLHIGRKGTDESSFFLHGAVDDLRIFNYALSNQEIAALFNEGGFTKRTKSQPIASPEVANGRWGRDGTTFLDLQIAAQDAPTVEHARVAGRVMDGRPGRWANIDDGQFNRRTGLLTLSGTGQGPDGNGHAPYNIIGTLDDNELTVSYGFGGSAGNLVFARTD